MKLLMTADTVGGVWTYALELARALTGEGVEVHLATMGARLTPDQREEACAIPDLEIHESAFRLEWMEEPWPDLERAADWLLDLERAIRPDLVHLNQYVHAALPWRAPVLTVGHSCVLSWWEAVRGGRPPACWRRYEEAVRSGLGSSDLVVAPTRAMLSNLERHYGPLGPSRVIPNGREAAHFLPGDKQPLVFSAGRLWDEAKNVAAVVEAARGLPWPALVAGERAHPSGSAVELTGIRCLGRIPSEEMAAWLGRASIYALPARYEPFGLSALEAALAGCALVLGDIPSLREVWGDAAVFVDPVNPDQLRAELLRLIEAPDARREMAHRARTRAFEYTPRRMAGGYLSAYRWLLARAEPEETGRVPDEEAMACAS